MLMVEVRMTIDPRCVNLNKRFRTSTEKQEMER